MMKGGSGWYVGSAGRRLIRHQREKPMMNGFELACFTHASPTNQFGGQCSTTLLTTSIQIVWTRFLVLLARDASFRLHRPPGRKIGEQKILLLLET
jgi:hypothetical protein